MQGEIICIGDELISGQVAERNATYAAGRLWPLGFRIRSVVIVGDDPGEMTAALNRALSRADFVLVTGGLGATEDDITAQVAAQVFDLPLTESARMVKNLRACFADGGGNLAEEARKMAWLPRGAEVLDDRCAGFRLTGPGGQPVFFLPGVPAEMRRLTELKVLPQLLALQPGGERVLTRTLKVFGLPEPQVGARLRGLTQGVTGATVGFYPVFPEVHVRLGVRAATEAAAEAVLLDLDREAGRRLADYVVASGEDRLEDVVARDMAAQRMTLALAESCTGGLISHRLTGVAGSSVFFERGMVVYSNLAKQELLGVKARTLATFGAVSAPCAAEMAQGARERAGVSLGLAVTGIAGPSGGSPEKPVGTVFFGLAAPEGVKTGRAQFAGERGQIKALSAETALDWLRRYLRDHAFVRSA
ncbi:MAG: CinA family nicotinamide mononucleotide deamidase-related protein [Deltaproteobacteria bacterium]|nr:CinA family nicotinamide mononucleotide deamidase-related protein [Deltaproteobacteria bacterium]